MVSLKKEEKKIYSESRNTVGEPGCGAALPQDPQPPHLFRENGETRRPADCMPGTGEELVTGGHRPKGREADSCTSGHHDGSGPPVHPQKCQMNKTPPPASTAARLFEGQLAKSHQPPFSSRILACPQVKFLVLARFCFYFYFLRKTREKTVESSTREPVCS